MNLLSDCIPTAILSKSEPTSEQLIDALISLKENGRLLESDIPQPDELPYGRKVLYGNTNFEVILVHLPAFCTTRIHDHGESIGAALVLEGQLINTLFKSNDAGSVQPYEHQHVMKDELFIATRKQIHQMSNPHAEKVVSLHIYAPPLNNVQVYV
ncbi:MAG: cysteine dioxygenase [Paenibacillus sp.]|nr:cysteine dioxygenase [Paenibacillus sp.]